MIWALWKKSFRDSWPLLLACCGLLLGFLWFRLWVVAQIDFKKAITLLAKMVPQFVQQSLPAPLEALTAGAGQVAFGWEEGPVLLLSALWSVSRGTHCLAGRLGDGSMEMLLAQPVRRITLVASHTGVTLVGAAAIAGSAWLGTAWHGIGIGHLRAGASHFGHHVFADRTESFCALRAAGRHRDIGFGPG